MKSEESKNRNYYDAFSGTYEDARHEGYHAMLDDLQFSSIVDFARGKDVLEVGCGTGLLLARVEPVAANATGIDVSPGMLRLAHQKGLHAIEGSATELPFEDGSFDLVYSFKVMSHVRDIETAIAEARRVLRPGGVLVFDFYSKHSLRYLARRVRGEQKTSQSHREDDIHTRWYTPDEVVSLFTDGWEIKDVGGARVFTPIASMHRLPVIGELLREAEEWASESPFRRFAGFLAITAQKV